MNDARILHRILKAQERVVKKEFGQQASDNANYGFVTGDNNILTKVYTNPRRLLFSEISAKDGSVVHSWMEES